MLSWSWKRNQRWNRRCQVALLTQQRLVLSQLQLRKPIRRKSNFGSNEAGSYGSIVEIETQFFHATTRNMRTCNRFTALEDDSGKPHYKEPEIVSIIAGYYHQMFSSNYEGDFRVVHETLSPSITPKLNTSLIVIPDDEEIRKAVFDIHPSKAPGHEGFSAGFYHSYWYIIGQEVCDEIRHFFASGSFLGHLNKTHVHLIPKVARPKRVADYRPIAMCNVFYNIIAKILTKRLQPILPNMISENQSAFVPGRAISDNFLITHEVLHCLGLSKAKREVQWPLKWT